MSDYSFKRVKWSLKADQHLKETMSYDSSVDVDWLRGRVDADEFILAGVYHLGVRIGSLVLNVDRSDMVVVAAGGQGRDLYKTLTPALKVLAVAWGCSAIRVHAQSKAVDRLLKSVGFDWQETIRRIPV